MKTQGGQDLHVSQEEGPQGSAQFCPGTDRVWGLTALGLDRAMGCMALDRVQGCMAPGADRVQGHSAESPGMFSTGKEAIA